MDDQRTAAVASELAEIHRRAKHAFNSRDLNGYMSFFAPDLEYKQADGRTIGLEKLTADVNAQMQTLNSADTTYECEDLSFNGDEAVETITQAASMEVTPIPFIHRRWNLTRRGRYVWRNGPDGWRILRVEVLEERVRSGGIRIGRAANSQA